jgi:type IV pilus assembly protein PilB
MQGSHTPLGQILVNEGHLDEILLHVALAHQREVGGRLGQVLVDVGFVDEDTVVAALGRQLNLPVIQLNNVEVRPQVIGLLKPDVVERYEVLPVRANKRSKTLGVATADPTNLDVRDALSFHTGMKVSFWVSGQEALRTAIRRHYQGEPGAHQPGMLTAVGATQEDLAFRFPSPRPERLEATISHRFGEVARYISRLERTVKEQSFALRGVLDLLDQKGLVQRTELIERLTADPTRPPPLPLPKPRRRSGTRLLST